MTTMNDTAARYGQVSSLDLAAALPGRTNAGLRRLVQRRLNQWRDDPFDTRSAADVIRGTGRLVALTGPGQAKLDALAQTLHVEDTFRVESHLEPANEEDRGMSREDAMEFFHRAGGRGLGLRIVNENTGEVIAKDD